MIQVLLDLLALKIVDMIMMNDEGNAFFFLSYIYLIVDFGFYDLLMPLQLLTNHISQYSVSCC